MNKYPLWKYILLAVVALVAIVYALPNLFGDDPAVQISSRTGVASDTLQSDVDTELKKNGFENYQSYMDSEVLVVRFENTEEQLRANDLLSIAFGDRHTIALNLVPATPAWLRSFAQPMYLGLDLRGGVHFLMEVDMESAMRQALERYQPDWRSLLRSEGVRYQGVQVKDDALKARFPDLATRDQALALLSAEYRDLEYSTSEDGKYFFVDAVIS